MSLLNNNKQANALIKKPNSDGFERCDKIHLVPRQGLSSKYYYLEALFFNY